MLKWTVWSFICRKQRHVHTGNELSNVLVTWVTFAVQSIVTDGLVNVIIKSISAFISSRCFTRRAITLDGIFKSIRSNSGRNSSTICVLSALLFMPLAAPGCTGYEGRNSSPLKTRTIKTMGTSKRLRRLILPTAYINPNRQFSIT